jgi:hypothetical protein
MAQDSELILQRAIAYLCKEGSYADKNVVEIKMARGKKP